LEIEPTGLPIPRKVQDHRFVPAREEVLGLKGDQAESRESIGVVDVRIGQKGTRTKPEIIHPLPDPVAKPFDPVDADRPCGHDRVSAGLNPEISDAGVDKPICALEVNRANLDGPVAVRVSKIENRGNAAIGAGAGIRVDIDGRTERFVPTIGENGSRADEGSEREQGDKSAVELTFHYLEHSLREKFPERFLTPFLPLALSRVGFNHQKKRKSEEAGHWN